MSDTGTLLDHFTGQQIAQIEQTVRWFPFRLVGAAVHPQTGEFRIIAKSTRHTFNRLARTGWFVVLHSAPRA